MLRNKSQRHDDESDLVSGRTFNLVVGRWVQPFLGRGAGLTLTMVRQSPQQTKVKVRFDNVYYPQAELDLYQHVWVAVDRQMFLDRSLDH